jgi:hypothetical protein
MGRPATRSIPIRFSGAVVASVLDVAGASGVVVVLGPPFAEQATTIIKTDTGQRIDLNVAASGPQLRRAAM